MKSTEPCAELLRGAYDLHMHPAPSPFSRQCTDYELLRAAQEAGMAGILLKSHYEPTAARAELANAVVQSAAKAYGAVALNWPVGGLNPYAVHNALKRGAKIVFMPTRDAANSLESGDMPGDFFKREGLTILDGDGALKAVVYEIMDVVKSYDGTLATGHLSPHESILLCRAGIERGVRMVLTHPEFSRTTIDAEVQREMALLGVFIEKCWYNIGEGECTIEKMAQNIRAVGAQHCFLCSDRGQQGREVPVEGMRQFMAALIEQGITPDEIRTMTREVPQRVLNL